MSHETIPGNRDGIQVLRIEDGLGDFLRVGYDFDGESITGRGLGFRSHAHGAGEFDGKVVRVIGQDLTALRDLILSLPDEAFPPILPAWQEGDVVIYDCPHFISTYTRLSSGLWSQTRVHKNTAPGSRTVQTFGVTCDDAEIDDRLKQRPNAWFTVRRGGDAAGKRI